MQSAQVAFGEERSAHGSETDGIILAAPRDVHLSVACSRFEQGETPIHSILMCIPI
jgi:hypothetical protein